MRFAYNGFKSALVSSDASQLDGLLDASAYEGSLKS